MLVRKILIHKSTDTLYSQTNWYDSYVAYFVRCFLTARPILLLIQFLSRFRMEFFTMTNHGVDF